MEMQSIRDTLYEHFPLEIVDLILKGTTVCKHCKILVEGTNGWPKSISLCLDHQKQRLIGIQKEKPKIGSARYFEREHFSDQMSQESWWVWDYLWSWWITFWEIMPSVTSVVNLNI